MKALRTSYCLVLIALAMPPEVASAQTMTLGSFPSQVFCAGDQVQLSYTADGDYTSKNSFVVQLSDATGSFGAFQNIGSVRTTASGMISVTIPTSVASGTAYRIRVISTDPYSVSADNGANLTVGAVPKPGLDGIIPRFISMVGEEMQFKHRSADVVSVRWDFGPDADPQISVENEPRVRFSTPGFKNVKLTGISAGGCEVTREYVQNNSLMNEAFIYVATCTPKIPSNVIIDSFESPSYDNDNAEESFWVVPGGEYTDRARNRELFVEAGGTVRGIDFFNAVYLKAGAALLDPSRGSLVIREPGASVSERYSNIVYIECDNVEFDYSDAPPYKIQQASVEKQESRGAEVYPNPASRSIYRTSLAKRLVEARLYNVAGSLVASSLEPAGREILSVRELPAGLYNLELHYADGIHFQKIMIQR